MSKRRLELKGMALIAVLACAVPTDSKTVPARGAETRQLGNVELVRLDVAFTTPTLLFGTPTQACAFFVFSSGEVGMRSVDAWACQGLYLSRYNEVQRNVSRQTQRWIDGK